MTALARAWKLARTGMLGDYSYALAVAIWLMVAGFVLELLKLAAVVGIMR